MKTVNPYLNFNGNTEKAFTFYQSVFGGELQTVRFKDFDDNPMGVPEADMDKIAHIALPLGDDNVLMGTDNLESLGQKLTVGNNFYIALETSSLEEAQTAFDRLADGGQVEMPLNESEWAEAYGMVTDKYGVQWMLTYTGSKKPTEQ